MPQISDLVKTARTIKRVDGMQDVYTVVTEAMLQALKDEIIFRNSSGSCKSDSRNSAQTVCVGGKGSGKQERIPDCRGSIGNACTDSYSDASVEDLYFLS